MTLYQSRISIPRRLAHLAISSVPGVTTIQPAELSIAKCAIYLNSLVLWMIHYCELESRFRSHTCLLFRFQMTPLPISHEKSLCLTSAPGVMMHSFGHCVRLITRIPLKETLFGCKWITYSGVRGCLRLSTPLCISRMSANAKKWNVLPCFRGSALVTTEIPLSMVVYFRASNMTPESHTSQESKSWCFIFPTKEPGETKEIFFDPIFSISVRG